MDTMLGGNSSMRLITTIIMSFLEDLYSPLRWFMVLAFVLVLFDWRWGIKAAKKRGEKVRTSSAGRRAINKMVDYFCWITIAGIINNMFEIQLEIMNIPIVQLGLLILIYSLELGSCYSNYFESRGIVGWDLIDWISMKTGLKLKTEINIEGL